MQGKHPLRFLVVDDNAHAAHLMKCVLDGAGFEVRKCHDAETAIATLNFWPCDAVVTDYEMAPVRGPDFVRAIRRHPNPNVSRMAVLMVTAYADERHVLEAKRAGVDGLIQKPFTTGILLERLFSVLTRSLDRQIA